MKFAKDTDNQPEEVEEVVAQPEAEETQAEVIESELDTLKAQFAGCLKKVK